MAALEASIQKVFALAIMRGGIRGYAACVILATSWHEQLCANVALYFVYEAAYAMRWNASAVCPVAQRADARLMTFWKDAACAQSFNGAERLARGIGGLWSG